MEQHSNHCFDEQWWRHHRRCQTCAFFNMTEKHGHWSLLVITQPKIVCNIPVIMLNKHGVYKVQKNKKGITYKSKLLPLGLFFLNLSSVKYCLWQQKSCIGFELFVRLFFCKLHLIWSLDGRFFQTKKSGNFAETLSKVRCQHKIGPTCNNFLQKELGFHMPILYSCLCFAECQELEAFPSDLGWETRHGSKLITGPVHARQPYTLTFTPRGNCTLIKLTWVTLKRGRKMK